mmetsp:Transcript_19442/g.49418  ORF Transcript_19442/g.49418 Transcript_19442/m.49418 type:complete len:223 (-) Transcript_19442:3369-4037(-)
MSITSRMDSADHMPVAMIARSCTDQSDAGALPSALASLARGLGASAASKSAAGAAAKPERRSTCAGASSTFRGCPDSRLAALPDASKSLLIEEATSAAHAAPASACAATAASDCTPLPAAADAMPIKPPMTFSEKPPGRVPAVASSTTSTPPSMAKEMEVRRPGRAARLRRSTCLRRSRSSVKAIQLRAPMDAAVTVEATALKGSPPQLSAELPCKPVMPMA